MDVNVHAEVKGLGLPQTPTVEREDRARPQVRPVEEHGDAGRAALGEQRLRENKAAGGQQRLSRDEATEMLRELQKRLDAIGNTRLKFTLLDKPHTVVVQITDRESGKLVKQFPPEEALQLRQRLEEVVGLLFDEKA